MLFERDHERHGIESEQAQLSSLRLHVLCASREPKEYVLKRTAELAANLGVRIELLIPIVVPYPLPLERPSTDLPFVARRLTGECERAGVSADIHLWLCRDSKEALLPAFGPESTIVIPFHERWPWRKKLLARTLRKHGHHVLLLQDESKGFSDDVPTPVEPGPSALQSLKA